MNHAARKGQKDVCMVLAKMIQVKEGHEQALYIQSTHELRAHRAEEPAGSCVSGYLDCLHWASSYCGGLKKNNTISF